VERFGQLGDIGGELLPGAERFFQLSVVLKRELLSDLLSDPDPRSLQVLKFRIRQS
jgi:hypothetical protein